MNTPRPSHRSSSSMVRRSLASRASRGPATSRAPTTLVARVEERASLPTWTDEQIDQLIDQVLSARSTAPSLDDTLLRGRWSFLPPPSTSRRTTVPVVAPACDEQADDDAEAPTLRAPWQPQDGGEPATLRDPRAAAAALGAEGLDATFERATVPSALDEGGPVELDEADLLEVMTLEGAREVSGEHAIEVEVEVEIELEIDVELDEETSLAAAEQLEMLDEWDELPPSLPQRTAMIPPEALSAQPAGGAALSLPTSWAGAWLWMFAGLAALLTLIAGLSSPTRPVR